MKITELAIDIAATRRITTLVVNDEITRPMREWVTEHYPDSRVTYLVNCPHCVSVWAGAAIGSGLVPRWVKLALALSASTEAIGWVGEVASSGV